MSSSVFYLLTRSGNDVEFEPDLWGIDENPELLSSVIKRFGEQDGI